MARLVKVSGWRPGPGEPAVHQHAEFLVAETWAEQGLLLDAFVSGGRPAQPTLALGGHGSFPIGPIGEQDTARWGIRLPADAPRAHVETLARAFERAAEGWRVSHQPAGRGRRPPPAKAAPAVQRAEKEPPRRRRTAPPPGEPHAHTVLAPGGAPLDARGPHGAPEPMTPEERSLLDLLVQRRVVTRAQLSSLLGQERAEQVAQALARRLNHGGPPALERVVASASGPVWRLHPDRLPGWAHR